MAVRTDSCCSLAVVVDIFFPCWNERTCFQQPRTRKIRREQKLYLSELWDILAAHCMFLRLCLWPSLIVSQLFVHSVRVLVKIWRWWSWLHTRLCCNLIPFNFKHNWYCFEGVGKCWALYPHLCCSSYHSVMISLRRDTLLWYLLSILLFWFSDVYQIQIWTLCKTSLVLRYILLMRRVTC